MVGRGVTGDSNVGLYFYLFFFIFFNFLFVFSNVSNLGVTGMALGDGVTGGMLVLGEGVTGRGKVGLF